MKATVTNSRCATTGRFISRTIGEKKATKFAEIEGIALNAESVQLMSRLKQRGLKGDTLREAILQHFKANRGK